MLSKKTILFFLASLVLWAAEPLSSWRDNATKDRIVAFVEKVTDKKSKAYVKPEDRIAVFDNDGTMWPEMPLYFELQFAIDEIKRVAPSRPAFRKQMPYKAVLDNRMDLLLEKEAKRNILTLLAATHVGMDDETFARNVKRWLEKPHPRFHRPYISLVYKPMLELWRYLEANGFTVFIVSGGGIDFMRAWIPGRYGIASHRVIGSYAQTKFKNGEIHKLPNVAFIDDKENKPVAIYRIIGKRPILACGNSDGDLAMLQYTAAGKGVSLPIYIHHTDAKREYAYDRKSAVGRLEKGLDEAIKRQWLLVDMKRDWKRVFEEK
ncbi:MAG: haloacid dehalogenase-like hydrolase [Epsilonproteobacteria bacterium]|nr:haloacid dehalogenase-like hydrolase [Campylobacterota bacterium]